MAVDYGWSDFMLDEQRHRNGTLRVVCFAQLALIVCLSLTHYHYNLNEDTTMRKQKATTVYLDENEEDQLSKWCGRLTGGRDSLEEFINSLMQKAYNEGREDGYDSGARS